MFAEHESVTLARDLPEAGLAAGIRGAIVHVYAADGPYELEVVADDGSTIALVTIEAADLQPIVEPDCAAMAQSYEENPPRRA